MNREEIKNDIKEFAKNILSKFNKDKFAEATLADGQTKIMYDGELTVGNVIYIVDSQGNKMPMPMGYYTLQDGTVVEIVDDMGTIGEVKKAEMPQSPEAPMATPAQPTAQSAEVTSTPPKAIVESTIKETRFNSQEEVELHIEVLEQKFSKDLSDANEKFAKVESENAKALEGLQSKIKEQEEIISAMFKIVEKLADMPSEKATETKTNVFKKFDRKAWLQEYKEDLNKYLK